MAVSSGRQLGFLAAAARGGGSNTQPLAQAVGTQSGAAPLQLPRSCGGQRREAVCGQASTVRGVGGGADERVGPVMPAVGDI